MRKAWMRCFIAVEMSRATEKIKGVATPLWVELMSEDVDGKGEPLEPEDDVSVDGEIPYNWDGSSDEWVRLREKGAVGELGYRM